MTKISEARIVLTVEEAAELLGIGRTLMYALVAAGEVESVRIGRLRRIPRDALVVYVEGLRGVPRDGEEAHPTAERHVERLRGQGRLLARPGHRRGSR